MSSSSSLSIVSSSSSSTTTTTTRAITQHNDDDDNTFSSYNSNSIRRRRTIFPTVNLKNKNFPKNNQNKDNNNNNNNNDDDDISLSSSITSLNTTVSNSFNNFHNNKNNNNNNIKPPKSFIVIENNNESQCTNDTKIKMNDTTRKANTDNNRSNLNKNSNKNSSSKSLPSTNLTTVAAPTTTTKHHANNYYTLEKRLFHALHQSQVKNPSIKEFKECWSFANAVRSFYYEGKENNNNNNIKLVLDVAGGHGALGALLLILLPSVLNSVIIDPAHVNSSSAGVELAWGEEYSKKQYILNNNNNNNNKRNDNNHNQNVLRYRHECLRTGLRKEIDHAMTVDNLKSNEILVVACHACQHLSDETLEIACSYGVHVTVMPCCQKDMTGGSFKALSSPLNMNIGVLMDLLTAGKVMSWKNGIENGMKYQVKMKLIDEKITPQNRLILCKANQLDDFDLEQNKINDAHKRLEKAYIRAHKNVKKDSNHVDIHNKLRYSVCIKSLGVGLVTGVMLTLIFIRPRK